MSAASRRPALDERIAPAQPRRRSRLQPVWRARRGRGRRPKRRPSAQNGSSVFATRSVSGRRLELPGRRPLRSVQQSRRGREPMLQLSTLELRRGRLTRREGRRLGQHRSSGRLQPQSAQRRGTSPSCSGRGREPKPRANVHASGSSTGRTRACRQQCSVRAS